MVYLHDLFVFVVWCFMVGALSLLITGVVCFVWHMVKEVFLNGSKD